MGRRRSSYQRAMACIGEAQKRSKVSPENVRNNYIIKNSSVKTKKWLDPEQDIVTSTTQLNDELISRVDSYLDELLAKFSQVTQKQIINYLTFGVAYSLLRLIPTAEACRCSLLFLMNSTQTNLYSAISFYPMVCNVLLQQFFSNNTCGATLASANATTNVDSGSWLNNQCEDWNQGNSESFVDTFVTFKDLNSFPAPITNLSHPLFCVYNFTNSLVNKISCGYDRDATCYEYGGMPWLLAGMLIGGAAFGVIAMIGIGLYVRHTEKSLSVKAPVKVAGTFVNIRSNKSVTPSQQEPSAEHSADMKLNV